MPPQMKSNPPKLTPRQRDFITCAYRLRYIASFVVSARRIANFIHEVDLFRRRRIQLKKTAILYQNCSLFLERVRGIVLVIRKAKKKSNICCFAHYFGQSLKTTKVTCRFYRKIGRSRSIPLERNKKRQAKACRFWSE